MLLSIYSTLLHKLIQQLTKLRQLLSVSKMSSLEYCVNQCSPCIFTATYCKITVHCWQLQLPVFYCFLTGQFLTVQAETCTCVINVYDKWYDKCIWYKLWQNIRMYMCAISFVWIILWILFIISGTNTYYYTRYVLFFCFLLYMCLYLLKEIVAVDITVFLKVFAEFFFSFYVLMKNVKTHTLDGLDE